MEPAILNATRAGAFALTLLALGPAAALAEGQGGAPGGPAPGSGPGSAPGASLVESLNQALERALAPPTPQAPGAAPTNALIAPSVLPAPSPVVVELFTSQGCSACPPADALLAELATRPDVLALSLHVDYWDYLGWEDPFAQPAFTARQKAYARAAGSRTLYTPQVIVGGTQSLVSPTGAELDQQIAEVAGLPAHVRLTVSADPGAAPGHFVIDLSANPPLDQGTVVQIVRFVPQAQVEILRGENAGRVLDFANVVTAWHAVAEWDGQAPLRLSAEIEGQEPGAVIVQSARPGKLVPLPGQILAAALLP